MLVIPLPPVAARPVHHAEHRGRRWRSSSRRSTSPRALDFSSFPSLLLLTTLFRLAINVCVTRLILARTATRGHVVAGVRRLRRRRQLRRRPRHLPDPRSSSSSSSSRTAPGASPRSRARFTLDAMPGKQMAIDADLNAGLITEEEARERRDDDRRARPTSTARWTAPRSSSRATRSPAMIITAINLIGGIVIGVMQQGMPIGEAAQHFTLLTIGDGLVAQIPALLISIATGIIVTRAASDADLGTDVAGQILEPAQGPDGRRRRHLRLRARPGPAEAARSSSSAAVLPGRPRDGQDRRAGGGTPRRSPTSSRPRCPRRPTPATRPARRCARPARARDRLRPRRRWSTRRPAARC